MSSLKDGAKVSPEYDDSSEEQSAGTGECQEGRQPKHASEQKSGIA